MSGLELSRRFYERVVGPLLGGRPHAAALLGHGSEVLGYDDDVSPDHDFGPRLQLFLPPGDSVVGGALAREPVARELVVGGALARELVAREPVAREPVARESVVGRALAGESVAGALAGLPVEFEGFPVAFSRGGATHHHVELTTAAEFFSGRLGVDPADGMDLADWLLTPTQVLGTLTAGAVFHDPGGALALRRDRLRWYPDDVWRYALAAAWLRVEQEEAFVGRAGQTGDDLGSRIVAARLARDLVRLAFLIERRWAPYSKWLGRAFSGLKLSGRLGPLLEAATAATGWRVREEAVVAAASVVAAATNDLGLCEPLDSAPRRFHTRDIRVVGAERYAIALAASITDPQVRALLGRLGHRRGGALGSLPGTIDQAVDSTDVLMHPDRCRAAASMLGLSEAAGRRS
jgi:hypothetical protein